MLRQEAGDAEALDGLALASRFLGDVEDGLELRQQAFAAFAAAGECDVAARAAAWISHQYLLSGRALLANGWLERAERVLEGRKASAGHGWVTMERARRADSVVQAAAGARQAMHIALAALGLVIEQMFSKLYTCSTPVLRGI